MPTKELLANASAGLSTTAAGITWIAQLNDILQLAATTIAIIAGIYAIRWHRLRIKNENSKDKS